MSTSAFIAVNARHTLEQHRLDSFEALWAVPAELVDEPNRSRGGVSSVGRLTLEDSNGQPEVFYLKRQSNYLIRNLRHPWGQPTAGRERDNIACYAEMGIPTLEVACYAQKRVGGQIQAILLTRALDGYLPLEDWFADWGQLGYRLQQQLLMASAALVARLHGSGLVHICLYPKHIFLKPMSDGMGVRFIDLEKSRSRWLSPWGRIRDLDALNRRSRGPSRSQRLRFLLAYLGKTRVDAQVRRWVQRIVHRSAHKGRQ